MLFELEAELVWHSGLYSEAASLLGCCSGFPSLLLQFLGSHVQPLGSNTMLTSVVSLLLDMPLEETKAVCQSYSHRAGA
jgi:hypothetical protein